jgi:hypothetical protein
MKKLSLAALAALLIVIMVSSKPHVPEPTKTPGKSPVSAVVAVTGLRPVFPYSLVPGGIHSVEELREAIAANPALADNYTGFDISKARVKTVSQDTYLYVSYTRDGQVYWTAKRLKIAKGETVLTDGKRMIRGRCGNFTSETPMVPVSPQLSEDPTDTIMDTPLAPLPDTDGPIEVASLGPQDVVAPSVSPDTPSRPYGLSGGSLCCSLGSPGSWGPSQPGSPGPTSMPEPPTSLLLGLGLGVIVAARAVLVRRLRRRSVYVSLSMMNKGKFRVDPGIGARAIKNLML